MSPHMTPTTTISLFPDCIEQSLDDGKMRIRQMKTAEVQINEAFVNKQDAEYWFHLVIISSWEIGQSGHYIISW